MKQSLLFLFILFLSLHLSGQDAEPARHQQADSANGIARIQSMIEKANLLIEKMLIKQADSLFQEALEEIHHLDQGQRITHQLRIQAQLGISYIQLFHNAEYEKSLALLLKILDEAKAIGDSVSQAKALRNLGFNYRFLSKFDQALQFDKEAVTLASEIKDTHLLLSALNEEANAYYYLKQLQHCWDSRLQALHIAELARDTFGIQYIIHDLAFLYLETKEYGKAQQHFLQNFRYSFHIKDAREISIAAENVAATYLLLNLPDSALFYLFIADSVTQVNRLILEKSNIYRTYSEAYAQLGNYPQAYRYLVQHRSIADSIFNLEKENLVNEITLRYETAKKEQENRILKQQYRTTMIITLVVAAFVLIIITMLLWNNWKKRSTNRKLAVQKEIIQRQRDNLDQAFEILRKREKELEEANASKDMFFSIIAHDLKSPFNTLLGFSDLLLTEGDSFNGKETKQMVKTIHDSASNLFNLLENLLEWTRAQTNRIEVKPKAFDVVPLVRKNIEIVHPAAENKKIEIHFNETRTAIVYADYEMIDFVIRNLLSNAIKYVRPNGEVFINLVRMGKALKVKVKDTGVGISDENQQRLFKIDEKVRTDGTSMEKGTGLGLIISKEFLELNHGSIGVTSHEGKGSEFFFTLPVE